MESREALGRKTATLGRRRRKRSLWTWRERRESVKSVMRVKGLNEKKLYMYRKMKMKLSTNTIPNYHNFNVNSNVV